METLTGNDAILFYQLWRPLLQHVNTRQQMYPSVNFEQDETLDVQMCGKLAAYMWEHHIVLDEFITSHPELGDRERQLVSSWKHGITGKWILERHLKSGSVFIGNNNHVYLVRGIVSSYSDMFMGSPLPLYVHATLLPFEDCIITDGLIGVMPVRFGPGMRQSAKDIYMSAKKTGVIMTKLSAGD